MSDFIVISKAEIEEKRWDELDFLFISGDAYVDHPSFGTAVICRLLESKGFKVGIIAQPDWHKKESFQILGKPKLAVLISAGNLDSMLNKLTSSKKIRSKDAYSPGGKIGLRPDRASIIYGNCIKQIWKNIPIILGGVEASLRRFVHYDYWSDSLRNSIVIDSRADLLVYGMGERQILEIAERLKNGEKITDMHDIAGTSYVRKDVKIIENAKVLPSYEEIKNNKECLAKAFKMTYQEQDPFQGKILMQGSADFFVIHNKPALPLSEKEMDEVYALPFTRQYHPIYIDSGGVPALEEVKFSIVSHRGCLGGCAFCAIHFHQGRVIQKRSQESIIKEAKKITVLEDFKGYIHDVGGPTANFRNATCDIQKKNRLCKTKQCMFPEVCDKLETSHEEYLNLLKKVRKLPNVKKVFIRSGLRYDFLIEDMKKNKNDLFLKEICLFHVSGQLKVAPEHISKKVTDEMQKTSKNSFALFHKIFMEMNKKIGKKQYLVPYFMTGHPGCDLHAAIELAEFIRDNGYYIEQIQDFIPTPGTMSSVIFYTEKNPFTDKKVFVEKSIRAKKRQKALLQYKNPKNYQLVLEALREAKRLDLIGFGKKCLLKPKKSFKNKIISK